MATILRTIQIPLFIKIETGSLSMIRSILDEHHLHFQKPLVISEEHILELGGNDAVHALGDPATVLFSESSIEEGNNLAAEIRDKGNDLVVSIGGGRVIDLGKYAATKAGVNYISIPTSPSNDGICSPVAVLVNEQGKTESIGVNMPIGILVDTKLLTTAPVNNIKAGIGDLVSNYSAIADWKLAYAQGKERMDDFAASMAYSSAELIFDTCRGSSIDLRSGDFLEKLVHGLILSGIAMNIAGNSRPCSGAEHEISHAIDLLYPGSSLHGLQVCYGTLVAAFLRDEPIAEFLNFLHAVDMPAHHSKLGLSDEQFVEVLLKAPETRPERYTILEKLNMNKKEAEQRVAELNQAIKNADNG
ncbi:MAG: iron-containing alcohol dehydrogenase family protein [Candidatus Kerfeldbacteria bacterium]